MKSLKIAICAQLSSPTITENLAPLLRARGHQVDILDLSTTSINDFSKQPEVQSLLHYDLIYYRSGLDDTVTEPDRIIELEAFLKDSSVKTVNLNYTKHRQAHSKIYETQLAEKAGLLIPKSVFATDVSFEQLSQKLGLPFITKTDLGTNGEGVHLIRSNEEFDKMRNTYPNTTLLHQEFIGHDFEYRMYMVAGTVIFITKKAPPAGDFRSNEAQGGSTRTAETEHTAELSKLAQTTYETFGFEIFVVDFMFEKNTKEFYFTEINLNPGLGSTDLAATSVDAISLMADYFEKRCA